jgi:hypothetical protein
MAGVRRSRQESPRDARTLERSSRQAREPARGWLCLRAGGPRRASARYRSRREPRPDRSPRSQRSLPPSATYGNSASSRARLTARATWL